MCREPAYANRFEPLSSVKHVQDIKRIIPRLSAQKEEPQIDLIVRSLAKAVTKNVRIHRTWNMSRMNRGQFATSDCTVSKPSLSDKTFVVKIEMPVYEWEATRTMCRFKCVKSGFTSTYSTYKHTHLISSVALVLSYSIKGVWSLKSCSTRCCSSLLGNV